MIKIYYFKTNNHNAQLYYANYKEKIFKSVYNISLDIGKFEDNCVETEISLQQFENLVEMLRSENKKMGIEILKSIFKIE